MSFQALTGAPALRQGVTLNIMAVPQSPDAPAERLAAGSIVTLRFGNCCPMVAEGEITARTVDPDRAVLRFGDTDWALEPGLTGVSIAGIVSEDWIVRGET